MKNAARETLRTTATAFDAARVAEAAAFRANAAKPSASNASALGLAYAAFVSAGAAYRDANLAIGLKGVARSIGLQISPKPGTVRRRARFSKKLLDGFAILG
jgi:hypothetical protein